MNSSKKKKSIGSKVKTSRKGRVSDRAPKQHQSTARQKKQPQQVTMSGEEFSKKVEQLTREKKYGEALELIESANTPKWQNLYMKGILAYNQSKLPEAEELCMQALREPDCKKIVYRNLGLICVMQGKLNQALPYLEKAYEYLKANKELDIKTVQAYLNALLDVSKADRVLTIADELEQLFPDDRAIQVSKASALRSVGKRDEALALLDHLIEKNPGEPVIHRIKADLLGDENPNNALPIYKKALALSIEKNNRPDPAIQWNMSLHLLRVREIAHGWDCWEQGFHPIVGTMGRNLPMRIKKLKRADPTLETKIDPEKWTIVVSEQGIGDQVLFLSVMNEAINELKKIIFITEARMTPILKRSFPNIIIAGGGATYHWEKTPIKKNGYIPLGSLPRRYRPDVKSFEKGKNPFLIANKDLYSKYREVLKKKAAGRPIIGISWKGGFWAIQRKTKQLELENWMPIFKKDAMYVNLQYGDVSQEIKYLNEKKQEVYFFQKIDFRNDLDSWLSIAAACDGIISVSTALVHFAGAVGQKVAVVMPNTYGPWHLGMEDEKSIAYKNVRIFRPTTNEPLDKVVERVAGLIIE